MRRTDAPVNRRSVGAWALGLLLVACAVGGPLLIDSVAMEAGPIAVSAMLRPILSIPFLVLVVVVGLIRHEAIAHDIVILICAAGVGAAHRWLLRRRHGKGLAAWDNLIALGSAALLATLAAIDSWVGLASGPEIEHWWVEPAELFLALLAGHLLLAIVRRSDRRLQSSFLAVLLIGSSIVVGTASVWDRNDETSLASAAETATISFLNGANDDLTVMATKVSSTGAETVTVDGFPTFIEVTVLGQPSITSGSLVRMPAAGSPEVLSNVSELGDLFDGALAEWMQTHPDQLSIALEIGTLIDLGIVQLPVPTGGVAPFYVVAAPLAADVTDPTLLVATMSVDYLLDSATISLPADIEVDFYSAGEPGARLLTSTGGPVTDDTIRPLTSLGETPWEESAASLAIGGVDYYVVARAGDGFGFADSTRSAALAAQILITIIVAGLVLALRLQADRRDHERMRREALLAAALQGSPGWTAIVDGDDRIEMTNDGPFHVRAGELVTSSALWSDEQPTLDTLRSMLGRARAGEASSMQVLWSDPSDPTLSMRIIEVAARPLPGIRLAFLQCIDVTEMRDRAMRTSQSERMEAIGVLAGGLAHDFNNLLFITLGYLQMLERQPVVSGDQQARTYVGRAVEAVERGAKVAKSLLSFARSQPLAASRVELGDYIKDLTPLIEQAIGSAHQLRIEVEDPQLAIIVDPGRLSSGLLNVVFNARDAMETKGQLTLRIAKEVAAPLEQEPRPVVAISISDTGKGMSPEVAARAFEPFFTTKKVGSGTGLGLATLYSFAQQSGGWAAIDSTEGVGTTVTMYLPPADSVATDDVVEERDATLTTRALVIDDEPALADLVSAWLGDLGIATRTANNPEAALRVAREFRPQLVISDANLNADLDGLELARLLVEEHPALIVVFMTGFSDRIRALQAAGVATLAKPFSREDLLSTLSNTAGLRWERGPRG